MSAYLGWTIVAMPAAPAPKSVEFAPNSIVGISQSPFTGQQQIQDWQAGWMEAQVTMPPMEQTDAQAWVTFLLACKGQANVFQLANTTFAGLVPAGNVPGTYWRLKSNANKWSVSDGVIYGFQFEIREAI
jgi:hypothetical protein